MGKLNVIRFDKHLKDASMNDTFKAICELLDITATTKTVAVTVCQDADDEDNAKIRLIWDHMDQVLITDLITDKSLSLIIDHNVSGREVMPYLTYKELQAFLPGIYVAAVPQGGDLYRVCEYGDFHKFYHYGEQTVFNGSQYSSFVMSGGSRIGGSGNLGSAGGPFLTMAKDVVTNPAHVFAALVEEITKKIQSGRDNGSRGIQGELEELCVSVWGRKPIPTNAKGRPKFDHMKEYVALFDSEFEGKEAFIKLSMLDWNSEVKVPYAQGMKILCEQLLILVDSIKPIEAPSYVRLVDGYQPTLDLTTINNFLKTYK